MTVKEMLANGASFEAVEEELEYMVRKLSAVFDADYFWRVRRDYITIEF